MRALRILMPFFCLVGLTAFDSPRNLTVPTQGEPSERVLALWNETKPILLADASEPLSDEQSVARGVPLIATWTQLQSSLANTDAAGEAHAVLKLLSDLYGRAQSAPARRIQVRNDARRAFAERLTSVENRLSR